MANLLLRSGKLYDRAMELVEFYRCNPVVAAQDLLFQDFPAAQKIMLNHMWSRVNVIITAGRGCGKSRTLAVLSALYAMLYPGQKILIIAPSYRQSKHVFQELKQIYTESPVLREACDKKPIVSSDRCYLDFRGTNNRSGSTVEAYPLGVGDKIRGLRGHLIVEDEIVHIPEEIHNTVIAPMGATFSDPMANVRRMEKLNQQLDYGVITQEEFQEQKEGKSSNKIVGVTSADFQFNYVYKRIKAFEEQIAKGSKKYSTLYFSYADMPEGFLDKDNIETAKATMSSSEFNREYRGIWESDSDGLFKASLIESCRSQSKEVQPEGLPGREYIMGVDPARSSAAFAVVVIEKAYPTSHVVAAFQATNNTFPQMAQIVYNFSEKFNVVMLQMDAGAGGGGMAIKDILSSPLFFKGHLLLDIDDPTHKNLVGRRIIRMHDPKPGTVAEMNYAALNLLEQGKLRFPKRPVDGDEKKEVLFDDISIMIKQIISVVPTETRSGGVHFDIPASGQGNRKKDLYSAFLLAAKALYDIINVRETSDVANLGIIRPVESRLISGPVITNVSNFSNHRGR